MLSCRDTFISVNWAHKLTSYMKQEDMKCRVCIWCVLKIKREKNSHKYGYPQLLHEMSFSSWSPRLCWWVNNITVFRDTLILHLAYWRITCIADVADYRPCTMRNFDSSKCWKCHQSLFCLLLVSWNGSAVVCNLDLLCSDAKYAHVSIPKKLSARQKNKICIHHQCEK